MNENQYIGNKIVGKDFTEVLDTLSIYSSTIVPEFVFRSDKVYDDASSRKFWKKVKHLIASNNLKKDILEKLLFTFSISNCYVRSCCTCRGA